MSLAVVPRDREDRTPSRRSSPVRDSPRPGQKRLRNGGPVEVLNPSGDQTPMNAEPGSTPRPRFSADTSIVLVGIRGSGKRSLGFIAAAALGRRFVTVDHYFQSVTGFSRQDYLRIHGSEEFHKQDVEISIKMLEINKQGCVIDCGLGSLTRGLQDFLKLYCQTNPVIYVQRDMECIKKMLGLSDRSAKLLEAGDPSHRRCSNFEFFNVEDNSDQVDEDNESDRASPAYSFKLREVQTDFSTFVRHLTNDETESDTKLASFLLDAAVETKLFTHILFLHLSTFRSGHIDFTSLQGGGDVVEVRIDEWQEGSARLITQLVAEVRRHMRVPVLLSAMAITDKFPVTVYFAALRHACRVAPDYLVVDLALEKAWLAEFTSFKSCTKLLGSIRGRKASSLVNESDKAIIQVERGISLGIGLIRISAPAVTRFDGEAFDQLVRTLKHRYASRVTFSAYLEGRLGRTSQVMNSVLTPVSHQTFQANPVPTLDLVPKITAYEAMQGLFSSFILDPLEFFVFGANVATSLSPNMHNAAYKAVGLWHKYTPVNVASWAEIQSYAKAFNFGGASIAQPFKVKIIDQLTSLSPHAKAVGAINTLIPLRGETGQPKAHKNQVLYRNRAGSVYGFYGDNSDWVSIQKTLNKNLSPRNVIHGKTTALVVGAGGMARAATYALLQMGCRNIFVYNRTVVNAEMLADHFTQWFSSQNFTVPVTIRVLESTAQAWPEGFAQPSIIVSCVTHERLPGEEHVADFKVPEQWLGSETGGAAVEQAYYVNTPFIQQIRELHATTGKPWVVVDGLEVLHEQATAQFEIMTGRKAPRALMWDVLQSAVAEQNGKV